MRWHSGLLVLASGMVAVCPAQATTYVGSLKGTITSGTAKYFTFYGWWQDISLLGKTVSVDFSASVKKNFFDTATQTYYPHYVVNQVKLTIDLPDTLGSIGGVQTNDVFVTPHGTADFTGNDRKGVFDIGGSLPTGIYDTQSVHLFFENPDAYNGTVLGRGIASAFTTKYNVNGPYYSDTQFYSNIKFDLTSGDVIRLSKRSLRVMAAVPEPSTWTLTIVGFGLIGLALRRRSAYTRITEVSAR